MESHAVVVYKEPAKPDPLRERLRDHLMKDESAVVKALLDAAAIPHDAQDRIAALSSERASAQSDLIDAEDDAAALIAAVDEIDANRRAAAAEITDLRDELRRRIGPSPADRRRRAGRRRSAGAA